MQAVAKFFEENPVQQCQPCTPGTLTGIPDITARALYDRYYGGKYTDYWCSSCLKETEKNLITVKYLKHTTVQFI